MRRALIFPFLLNAFILEAQFIQFTSFHDTLDAAIEQHLLDNDYKMVTVYYDNVNEVDGKWQFYPTARIDENITAIAVSGIPGEDTKYTYLLFFSKNDYKVQGTFGPYYDSRINAIDVKIKGKDIVKMKVRLINPPEPFDLDLLHLSRH